jgi:hypothetical protein
MTLLIDFDDEVGGSRRGAGRVEPGQGAIAAGR